MRQNLFEALQRASEAMLIPDGYHAPPAARARYRALRDAGTPQRQAIALTAQEFEANKEHIQETCPGTAEEERALEREALLDLMDRLAAENGSDKR